MSTTNLIKLLPKVMRNQFWADFASAIDTELQLFLDSNVSPKEDTFNIRNLTELSDLQNITSEFGYTPNTIINDSIDFFKSEIKAISYKIKRKTTYPGYNYIFKSIPMIGYTYNLYWDDINLIRAIDSTGTQVQDTLGIGDGSTIYFSTTLTQFFQYLNQSVDIEINGSSINVSATDASIEVLTTSPNTGSGTYDRTTGIINFTFNTPPALNSMLTVNYKNTTIDISTYLSTHDLTKPFTDVIPEYYYSFIENIPFTLDADPIQYLDTGLALDTSILKTTTHHLSIELFPITLMTLDAVEYLITIDYLDYLFYNVNYNKKTTENPHVMASIFLITDDSRYYNNLSQTTYTVNDLKANFAVTQNYSPTDLLNEGLTLVAGTETQPMFAIGYPLGNINNLAHQIYFRALSSNELVDTTDYYLLETYIPNESIIKVLAIGDGCTSNYSGTFDYGSIIPRYFYLTYTANSQLITLNDADGSGVLQSSTFYGTINYDTGDYNFRFSNVQANAEIISSGNTSSINSFLAYNTVILDSTFTITYQYSGTHIAHVDYLGNITGDFITSGSIIGSHILISFSVTIETSNVICDYTFTNYSIPTLGEDIIINYKTNDNVPITEIGVYDKDNLLILYATIPPIYAPERIEYSIGTYLAIKK